MKKIISIIFLLSLSACSTNYFLYNSMSGLDFSKGKWLIGEIEANSNIKANLANLAQIDLSEYLGDRVKYALNERSLLLPRQIPLNPSKSTILDLKKGTNFDYYINIKSKNARNDLSDFEAIDHFYYKKQMSYALVVFQVYDLNTGEIIYTQACRGSIDEDNSMTSKPTSVVILGCYNRIIDDIKKKSIKPI